MALSGDAQLTTLLMHVVCVYRTTTSWPSAAGGECNIGPCTYASGQQHIFVHVHLECQQASPPVSSNMHNGRRCAQDDSTTLQAAIRQVEAIMSSSGAQLTEDRGAYHLWAGVVLLLAAGFLEQKEN